MQRIRRESWFTNRIASRANKHAKGGWCLKCDRNLIVAGQKCSVCGYKEPHIKNKKDKSFGQ